MDEEIKFVGKYFEAVIKIPKSVYRDYLEYAMKAILYECNGDIVNLIENPKSFKRIVEGHQERLDKLREI